MTPSPRSRPLDARRPRWRRALRGWHRFCILPLTSGCFYFGGIPWAEEDQPPQIVSSNLSGVDVLNLAYDADHTTYTVFVAAVDHEGEDLVYAWTEDGSFLANALLVNDVSTVELTLAPDLDGRELRCDVADSAGNTTTVSVILGINRSDDTGLLDEGGA